MKRAMKRGFGAAPLALWAAAPAWGQGTPATPPNQPAAPATPPPPPPAPANPDYGGDFWTRSRLTGDWGGVRNDWAAKGFTVDLNFSYVYQNVVSGGFNGPNFGSFSDESENGNTVNGDLLMKLDTGKAGLWPGGFFAARLEGRAGKSIVDRAGSVSPVNVNAMLPANDIDDETWGLTEFTCTQFLSEKFGVFGGLLNTAEGDTNPIAGNFRQNTTFLNASFLASMAEMAAAPNVTLGGGLVFLPTKNITGSVTLMQSQETATHSPWVSNSGYTLATEWTFKYQLWDKPGSFTGGVMYSARRSRADIAADPRVILRSVFLGQGFPTTDESLWVVYGNAAQYLQGDEKHGWGPFLRLAVSNGSPNTIRWNVAGGLGGIGIFPGRPDDRWGAGIYYIDMTDTGLLSGLNVNSETGGEVFYDVAITPALGLTLDAQVVDQALPRTSTATVLGMRLRAQF
jgi:porin